MSKNNYQTEVSKRFTIYNSLFLDLPFSDIHRTGTLLPILSSKCQEGFEKDKTPKEIIRGFFNEMMANNSEEERHDLLFKMVQYVERQVVLFDSIEDAAFERIHDIKGRFNITSSQIVCKHYPYATICFLYRHVIGNPKRLKTSI